MNPFAHAATPANESHRCSRRAAAITSLILAQGFAETGAAQTSAARPVPSGAYEPTKLDAMVVADSKPKQLASPKFTEPLRDTPQTVVIIPNDVYTQQGATSLSEAIKNTPGITFAAGEGGGASATAGDAFYLRGFDASSSIFVDGVRDVGAYSRDVYNLEQVEVAKGPAGTDVGRGASSGYINVATKIPRLENFVAGAVSFGFDDDTSGTRQRATLDVNQSLPNSPLQGTAVRVNAMWQDSDAVGRDVAHNKGWAIAPSLALGLGTPTRAFIAYQHSEQDNLPDYGLPGAQFSGFVSTPQPPQLPRSTYYGFTRDFDHSTNDAVTARLEHDVSPDLRLSNQIRFSANERDAVVTVPGQNVAAYVPATGLLTRGRQANKRNTDILSNQTNFVARLLSGKIRHDLTGGLEFSRENAYSPAFNNVTLTPVLMTSPDANAVPNAAPTRSGAYTDVRLETAALYVFDTLKFNEHWLFNGGLRWERYDTDFLSVAAPTGVASRIAAAHTLLTWKGGVVYKPTPAGSLYTAYAVSQKPPGSDFTLSSAIGNQNNPDTDPQETTNVELGVKWDLFGGRLATTAALFETVNDKTVFTDPILGAIPAGKQTVRGLELSVSGRITDAWLVFGGFAYLDSEVNTGTAAQISFGLPLIPKVSGNLWSTYRLSDRFTIGGGAQYQGEANRLQNTAGAPVAMPRYWLFNALASYQINSRLNLRFNVNNLFDEDYAQSYNNNGGRWMPGSPRAYLATASFRF